MSWHDVLTTIETAMLWSVTAGVVAWLFSRHLVGRLIGLLEVHVLHLRQVADELSTTTDGGLADVFHAITDTEPSAAPAGSKRKPRTS